MRITTIKPTANFAPAPLAQAVSRRPFWLRPIAAAVLGIFVASASTQALALALGRISVQSSIGEPLRAEIDIPDINADEAASLRTTVASPDAFKAAGLDYNNAINDLKITLLKRPDGRSYLRLVGDKTINDPFVDLILEANWAAGRVVRDYTLLFDPPATKPAPAAAITAPQAASAPAAAPSAPAASPSPAPASASSTPSNNAPATERTAPVRAASVAKEKIAVLAKKPAATAKDGQIKVNPGDTAGRIAASVTPTGVSLDQMLLALLQANPQAFIAGDINRVKSGALLTVPTAEQAGGTPTAQAKQMLYAQSKDFNEFRRKLAQNAPKAAQSPADRSATGTVQAKVDDKKLAAATPDKLTLSKGGVQSKAVSKEDAIAKDKASKDASARVAELSKNISDLNKLNAAPAAAPSAAPATAANTAKPAALKADTSLALGAGAAAAGVAAVGAGLLAKAGSAPAVTSTAASPSVPVTPVPATSAPTSTSTPTLAVVAASTPAAVSATLSTAPVGTKAASTVTVASATTSTASASVAAASAPAPAVVKVAKAPPPPPAPEPSFVEELMDNPLVLPAAGGLVAALGGFAFWRSRQRKKNVQVDSSFLESRLQPDSFFGASGGQRVDTAEAGTSATASSMVYSPSQLDAAGDVDPVAEADVYLAYGRDLQAEEILKEAMRTNPSRVAVHFKLLEIYAKRRDVKAFEVVAAEAYGLCQGQGDQWQAASELGRELDPANPMYKAGGQPQPAHVASAATSAAFAASTMPQAIAPEYAQADQPDVDLDLDFSMGDEPDHSATSPVHVQPTIAFAAQAEPEPTVDFPFEPMGLDPAPMPPSASAAGNGALEFSSNDLNFSMDDISFDSPAPAPAPAPVASANGALEFDLGSLSLDLPKLSPAGAGASLAHEAISDEAGELETKLALAEEFSAIGDIDGARSLAQEVVDFGSGALKTKAQKFISALA